MTENNYFIISYFPMIAAPDMEDAFFDGSDIEKIKPLLKDLDNINHHADGLAWSVNTEPVFIMKFARAIKMHLDEWSDGKPEEWFKMEWMQQDDKYAMVLMPNPEKSVERQKVLYEMVHGEPLPENTKFQMIFKPLTFISMNSETFNQIKGKLLSMSRIGITEDPTTDEVYWFGNDAKFEIVNTENGYLKSLFEEET